MELPKGFKFAGTHCGIKKKTDKDVGLITSDVDCVAAGVYTKNIIRAACVEHNLKITPSNELRAVVINSGNANACTGELGEQNCEQTAQFVAEAINATPNQVLVLSTGVIGEQLPMQKLVRGITSVTSELNDTPKSFDDLAASFLTTDQFKKVDHRTITIGKARASIAGIAKGAGMIGPNMATMLCVVMTDLALTTDQANKYIRQAVGSSFNCISVDGHTSTNDAVLLLASGAIGNSELTAGEEQSFLETLTACCIELAKMIPTDGEGADHLIEIQVSGTRTDEEADKIARTVASSNLVKTAISGNDPNWGRISSAVGYSGVNFSASELTVKLNKTIVFIDGKPAEFEESALSQSMANSNQVLIEIQLKQGNGRAIHWCSDLTCEYVQLNSEYRT
ncbi:MAG: bifunctional glutamate N-acetyltransferase/amino-acid acetyltransferase ArgJ [Planctomycetota bacterium]